MSSIENVSMDKIKANPFRMLKTYPYSEEKLTILVDSIEETGFWEGVIARRFGGEFQLAFGHHRIEAARRLGLESVPLVIRELSDKQMIQYMGRENMEDFTSFSVLLEAWEAAANYLSTLSKTEVNTIEIAKLLGWTRKHTAGKYRDDDSIDLTTTARATNGALKLIKAGYQTHADFEGLHITAVRHLVDRAQSLMNQADRTAETQNLPDQTLEKYKKQIAKGVSITAQQSREGKLATDSLRAAVDLNTYQFAHDGKKQTPLFAMFGKQLADSIGKMLKEDAAAEKIGEIAKVLGQIVLTEDEEIIKRIDFELAELSERIELRRKQLSITQAKILPMKLIQIGA